MYMDKMPCYCDLYSAVDDLAGYMYCTDILLVLSRFYILAFSA